MTLITFSQLKILLYIQKYSTLSLAENNEKRESFANLQIFASTIHKQ